MFRAAMGHFLVHFLGYSLERTGKHRRGADGIIRPSPAIFAGYMVWLMTLPMVSAASRFISAVAWV